MELDEEMLVTGTSWTGVISASWALKLPSAHKERTLFLKKETKIDFQNAKKNLFQVSFPFPVCSYRNTNNKQFVF